MNPHDCSQELANAGLKSTTARLGVLEILESRRNPLDVRSIADYLKKKKIKADKGTIFRIMHAFVKKGLVSQIQLHEGKFRYEHTGFGDHHHFICEKCDTIYDIENCSISKTSQYISKKMGHLIKRHSLEFFGLCYSCNKIN